MMASQPTPLNVVLKRAYISTNWLRLIMSLLNPHFSGGVPLGGAGWLAINSGLLSDLHAQRTGRKRKKNCWRGDVAAWYQCLPNQFCNHHLCPKTLNHSSSCYNRLTRSGIIKHLCSLWKTSNIYGKKRWNILVACLLNSKSTINDCS